MTAKEYLKSVRYMDQQIDVKLEQIMRLRDARERITSVLNPNRGSGRTVRDATASSDRLIDLERELDKMVDRLVDRKRVVIAAFDEMGDPRNRMLLEMRYLLGYTWEGISEKMALDLRWVHRLHGRALAEVKYAIESHAGHVV